ncbi:MAG: restriction endonuclease, partial [Acidimicrobiia bacterium]
PEGSALTDGIRWAVGTLRRHAGAMPKRTNLFQQVVALIHTHMARGASVEESAMLVNRVTGEEREVDVAIRAVTAGHEVTVAVEARSSRRRADASWVEGMLGKHANLPTDKLVLVSQSGFTRQARMLAEEKGAAALEPSDLTGADPAGRVVNRLKSIWPKIVSLSPERAQVTVERPEGEKWFKAPADLWLYLPDGTELGNLQEFIQASVQASWEKLMEDIGLRDIARSIDRYFTVEIQSPTIGLQGVRLPIFARYEDAGDGPELHRITHLRVVGQAHIEVVEVELSHQRLGDVLFSQGTSTIAGRHTLIVATEDEEGGQISIRFGDATTETLPIRPVVTDTRVPSRGGLCQRGRRSPWPYLLSRPSSDGLGWRSARLCSNPDAPGGPVGGAAAGCAPEDTGTNVGPHRGNARQVWGAERSGRWP